eukprot:6472500-Amphidinium_carterae.1
MSHSFSYWSCLINRFISYFCSVSKEQSGEKANGKHQSTSPQEFKDALTSVLAYVGESELTKSLVTEPYAQLRKKYSPYALAQHLLTCGVQVLQKLQHLDPHVSRMQKLAEAHNM